MAKPTNARASKYDPDQVENIPLDKIFADRTWNSRSEVENDSTDTDGKTGNRGWAGLVCSLATSAQRDPVTVRPNPNAGKVKGEPGRDYLLVAGFQRYDAKLFIAHGDEKTTEILIDPKQGGLTPAQVKALETKTPTIRAFIKELDEAEARAENLAENMQRNSLSGPDIAYGVMQLFKANPELTSTQVAIILNQSQGYVLRLKKIAEGTFNVVIPAGAITKGSEPTTMLDAWRVAPKKLTQPEMLEIAQETDEKKKVDIYTQKASNKIAAHEPGGEGVVHRGKGTWALNMRDKHAPVIGTMLGTLEKMGVITINRTIEGTDVVKAAMAPCGQVKENASAEEIGMIAGALQRAVRAAIEAKPVKKEEKRDKGNGKAVAQA